MSECPFCDGVPIEDVVGHVRDFIESKNKT